MSAATRERGGYRRLGLGVVGLGVLAAGLASTWVLVSRQGDSVTDDDDDDDVVDPCSGPPNYLLTEAVGSATDRAARVADSEPRTALLIAASALHVVAVDSTIGDPATERAVRTLLATALADELGADAGVRTYRETNDTIKLVSEGELFVGVGDKGGATVWQLHDGRPVARNVLVGDGAAIEILAIAPTGRRVAAAGKDQSILVWDIGEEGQPGDATILEGQGGEILDLVFSSDGASLFSCASDGSLQVWSQDPDWSSRRLPDQRFDFVRLGLTRDDRFLFAGDRLGMVERWDLVAEREPVSLPIQQPVHEHEVTTLVSSPNGEYILSAGHTARLWTLAESDQTPTALQGHRDAVISASFSADASWVATASRDHTVRVWPLWEGVRDLNAKGSEIKQPGGVEWVAFGRDDEWTHDARLYTGSLDGTIHIHDPADRQKHQILAKHDAAVSGMVVPAPADYLVSASLDGTMLVLPVSPRALVRTACEVVGRNPSEQEWTEWLPHLAYQSICD